MKDCTVDLIQKQIAFRDHLTLHEKENLNKKLLKVINMRVVEDTLKRSLNLLNIGIDAYKMLLNRTEMWEGKRELDYNFQRWNELKKMNTFLTKYYNIIKKLHIEIEDENKGFFENVESKEI